MGTLRIDTAEMLEQIMSNPLTPSAAYSPTANVDRLMRFASPELRVILDQINDIATDSQQEQHIIF